MSKVLSTSLIAALSLGLAACGSDSKSSDTKTDPAPAAKTISFSDTPIEFLADFNGGVKSVCYDVESHASTACTNDSKTWDLRFDNDFKIWLNGGVFGKGDGGAFGPRPLAEMQKFKGGAKVPGYFNDQVGGTFLENSWYAYSLKKQNKLWPNFRVYVVKSNQKYYKIRMTGYYAPAGATVAQPGTSGVISFDYQDITAGATTPSVSTIIDASAGGFGAKATDPKNKYTYFSFADNKVVELTDVQAETSAAWDIAFKRTKIKVNSANATTATEAALAEPQNDFYGADKAPIKETFFKANSQTEKPEFDRVDSTKLAGLSFAKDGNKPYLGKGWYIYENHTMSAAHNNHWVVRTAERSGYAIVSISEIATDGRKGASYKVKIYKEVKN